MPIPDTASKIKQKKTAVKRKLQFKEKQKECLMFELGLYVARPGRRRQSAISSGAAPSGCSQTWTIKFCVSIATMQQPLVATIPQHFRVIQ